MKFERLFRHWKDVHEFEPKQLIYSRRDPADAMYLILSGEVEIRLDGKVLSVERDGGLIGEMAMLETASRSATAKARTKVRLARIDRGQLRELIGRDQEFALHVMAALANRLRAVDSFITAHIGRES